MSARLWALALGVLAACAQGGDEEPPADPAWEALFGEEGVRVDTVGVRDLTRGDTTSAHPGLVVVDRHLTFPPDAAGGEVFAWEFYAVSLAPVKLLLVRFEESGKYVEIIGESEMVVPAHKGVNRLVLREPIPIAYGCMMGFVQPREAVIPFEKITGYKTMITARAFERPLMRRDIFAIYGWRYSLRVFWRKRVEETP